MKTKNLVALIALVTGLLTGSVKAITPADGGYVYKSQNLNLQVTMYFDWQSKAKIDETSQSVTFDYTNPGSQQVFLYSITKISEQSWLNIKDQMQNVHVVADKGGMVYFVELTDKASIKGPNAKEYKDIVEHLDDIPHSVQLN
jgi:hypothetical protein